MIRFDTATLKRWEENNINDITCTIVNGGCAGKKVEILEYNDHKNEIVITQEGLRIHTDQNSASLLENAKISNLDGKWICISENINSRCGCGKSFSIKTGNTIQDKIERMKALVKIKRGRVH